ncbi:alpha/beta hydrolase [Acinetobacter shaoyimingii]|uniref:Alpha/beta hydrolase n=1 Tax=Acinetobacter shaoyimingii TaxID=2715164 RepID=A0A6G8RVY1_9GAMM|nr:alpha/beta hydrolase [Acinetobacter shaoyimingii]QIO06096.1 alpha/beta hydrolase [Acinetobacter shaoyimingii]
MNHVFNQYQADILGPGYECMTLSFPDDYEGSVVANLVRKKANAKTSKAVLYVHGFIDYFFQTEMAEQFNQHGYDFYALDLRKYGRSLLPHQKPYFVLNLREYDAEITAALEIIGQEEHEHVLLSGHSTGGLTTTLYAAHYPDHPLIKGLWLNSPFYDFNMNIIKKKIALPQLSRLGAKFPNLKFPSELNKWYVQSLHRDFFGEWEFNLNWKPKKYPKVYISFVHAIYEAQKEIHQGIKLNIPVLVMHSDKTRNPRLFNRDARTSDVILDVKTIQTYANKIQSDVNVITIKDGLHDLVLSAANVREKVYTQLFAFLKDKNL